MGFNYLQTDDRDNYLSMFKSKKSKTRNRFKIINQYGDTVCVGISIKCILYVKKKYSLTPRFLRKGKWKSSLIERGYKIEVIED